MPFPETKEAIEACRSAAIRCRAAIDLVSPLAPADPDAADHARLLTDCMDACWITARMLARTSTFAAAQARHTASVCRSCAEACRIHEDWGLASCAESCERAGEACHTFAVDETWGHATVRAPRKFERPAH